VLKPNITPPPSLALRRRRCNMRAARPIPHPTAFAPAALRATLASGGKPCGLSPPRVAWRPSIPPNRQRRIGQGQRPAAGQCSAGAPRLAAAGCANACRPQRWWFSPITSRRTVHGHPARHRHGASTPRLKTGAARCGRGVLACRRVVDLARVRERAGATFMRGCRAGPLSFRSGSAQGVLVLL